MSQAKTLRRLAAAGFDDGQQTLDEPTAGRRLRAERELSPDHRVPQRLLGGVVGRLDAFDLDESPQVFAVFHEFLAEAVRQRVVVAAQQERIDLLADRLHLAAKGAAGDRAVANFLPEGKQFLGRPHQVVAEAFVGLDKGCRSALGSRVSSEPSTIASGRSPVHPGAVAVNDAGEVARRAVPASTSAARLVRQAKKVKVAATKVQTHALAWPSLVGDSSMCSAACLGSCSASSS